MAVTKVAYFSLCVMELEPAEKHYTDVVGLRVTGRAPGQVYLQAPDAQDHHCIILNASNRAGVEHIGFKVSESSDLEEAEAAARRWELPTQRVPLGAIQGQSDGLKIEIPTGHVINLFHHADNVGYSTGMHDPDPIFDTLHGVGPVTHLDHGLIAGPDSLKAARFLNEELDFAINEIVEGPDGAPALFFLSATNTLHNLAIGPGPLGALHHVAFYVHDRADVIRRVDMLKHRGVATFKPGITRHGIGGVSTVYFHDPSGNRNEFQCGAYDTSGVPGRVAPVVWDWASMARGIFYYENDLYPEFLSVVT